MIWQYSNYSKINPKIKGYFPFKNPRKNQLETISEIVEAIDKGYKYIVLEAGTGTGKSAIAATLAQMYDSTFILTVTKQLQDQYLNDFKDLGFKVVKGRNNFRCRKYGEDNVKQNCDEGRCIVEGYYCEYCIKNKHGEDITKERSCHYDYQKYLGLLSKTVISNYPYLFLELNYVQDFTKRKLMIFDEAHNLEDAIMNQLKLEFKRKELKEHVGINLSKETIRTLSNGDYKTWIEFIEKIKAKYLKEFNKIKNINNRPELNQKKLYLKKRIDDCNIFITHINHDPGKWIFDYDSYWEVAEFKPIKVDKYAKDTFLKYGDVCIFMSATILDYKLFAEWLGLREDEIYAIRQKSPFEINRNPIVTFNDFSLSYRNLKENAPKTLDTIREILEKHKDEKGIIHTVSYNCKNFLKKNIETDRFIDHKTYNRARQLTKFKKSKKPLVLISPSMNEGVDLPGPLCRFQIIYKIPYPTLADKQTNLRKRMDPEWYKYKTSLSLVQTLGRGMRHEDDYCTTYFIDNRLKGYVLMDKVTNNFLPDTFVEAIDIEPADIAKDKDEAIYVEETQVKREDKRDENNLYDEVMGIEPSNRQEEIGGDDNPYRTRVNEKLELIKRGKALVEDGKYEDAIEFYVTLLNNELFLNDYHPFLKLAKLYHKTKHYKYEADIISRFFKSGVHARKSKIKWFKKCLLKLDEMGYFDKSNISNLEKEFNRNGALNKDLASKPVPIAYYIIKSDKNANKNPNPFHPDDFNRITESDAQTSDEDKIKFKSLLIQVGDRLMVEKEYDRLIALYTNLLNHKLFENDYYLYRKLAIAYNKNHKYDREVDIIVEFFKSGIYCDKDQIKWFEKKLKTTSKYGSFDFSTIDDLKGKFNRNGALNKDEVNIPVLSANNIKGGIDPLEVVQKPRVNYDKRNMTKKQKKAGKYSSNYFNDLARGISELPDYVSDRDLSKHEDSDFEPILNNHDKINEKANLIFRGKELEKEDPELAVDFYDELRNNELFSNDYYPYRRQCILFKNKINDDLRDWNTIVDIFKKGIYLNNHQFIWLKNKILELKDKLNLSDFQIERIKNLVGEYIKNENMYRSLQGDSIPIAERIVKNDDGLKLLSQKKYDMLQDIYYRKEWGVGYIRRKEYDQAIEYHLKLLNEDFLFFKYHAYKQLARISREMDDEIEFEKLYMKYSGE